MILRDLHHWSWREGTVVTLGTFDGVHRGHRALLNEVKKAAERRGVKSVVVTFPEPPQNCLDGKAKKPLILPLEKKLEMMEACGIEAVVIVEFEEIGWMSPEEFARRILKDRLGAVEVVVGYDCRFGRDRAGDGKALRSLGRDMGFEVKIIEPVVVDGVIVSSTEVRRAIRAGEVERAARLLGYAPLLCARVVEGVTHGLLSALKDENETEMKKLPEQLMNKSLVVFEGRRPSGATVHLEIDEGIVRPEEGMFLVRAREQGEVGVMSLRRPRWRGSSKACFELELFNSKLSRLEGTRITLDLLKKL